MASACFDFAITATEFVRSMIYTKNWMPLQNWSDEFSFTESKIWANPYTPIKPVSYTHPTAKDAIKTKSLHPSIKYHFCRQQALHTCHRLQTINSWFIKKIPQVNWPNFKSTHSIAQLFQIFTSLATSPTRVSLFSIKKEHAKIVTFVNYPRAVI